jgi:hypothetical protein
MFLFPVPLDDFAAYFAFRRVPEACYSVDCHFGSFDNHFAVCAGLGFQIFFLLFYLVQFALLTLTNTSSDSPAL